ncbi:MAG: Retroviral aspartyl protease [Chloroflexi bacterium]|nr:Retroviral aspartyl protease [Chloroflexota bacterium]MYE40745.1 Retroviral aspartyl protease [Chloroflexota bacterium]
MGTFTVSLTVGNLETGATETVNALVDTGATYSMIPASVLERIGITPTRSRRLRIASGERVERQTALAFFETEGYEGEARVVFGPEGLYLLGATALEDMLLVVDPVSKRLVPEESLLT